MIEFYIDGKLIKNHIREFYIKNNHPDVYDNVLQHSEKNNIIDVPFSQKLYNYIYEIDEIPLCNCGKKLKFKNFKKGYGFACSSTCLHADKSLSKQVQEKIKKTTLEKYGAEHVLQTNKFKTQIEKTTLERYGVKNASSSDIIKKKKIETCLKKYGVEHNFQSDKIKEKIKNTNIERYGVEYALQSSVLKEKFRETCLNNFNLDNPLKLQKARDTINSQEFKDKLKIKNFQKFQKDIIEKYPELNILKIYENRNIDIICPICNKTYTIYHHLLYERYYIYNYKNPCTHCIPINCSSISNQENEIINYLKSIIKFSIIQSDRKILKGKELDIYIPEKKIAIELDGLYWHSELFKDNNYHLNKTKLCQEQDIQLIHILEDEWLYKQEIVKSRLKNILGLTENKIGARKCTIREVDSIESRQFLEKNHIQGYINSKIRIGLYYNDELVSLMTFGNLRKALGSKSREGHYELLRFCNKLNTTILGGASKLFKYFLYNYQVNFIISYADRRWSIGELYKNLGFKELEPSSPNYWYINNHTREHRFNYRKSELIKQGFNKNKSEHDIMFERGLYRIYDCGNLKFEYKK